MGNFLMGIVVALVVAFGVYYVWVLRAADETENQPSPSASVNVDTAVKKIPAGAIMEDGTLPE
jgi:hypothetical protein